jgi:two-component system KDP operon response regulator KdpE
VSRVLVVEDDDRVLRPLALTLTSHGYDVTTVGDGQSALAAAAEQVPDLVVLDLGLPDIDGNDVIERLRTWAALPILVLSARETQDEKVRALDAGADDYVTKPFGMEELLARIRVALRRSRLAGDSPVVVTDAFVVDLAAKTVRKHGGADIKLTPTEWAVLEALAREPGALISQRELLDRVWGPQYAKETHYLRVFMGQLRRKLEPDPGRPRHLLTVPGRGYRLVLRAHHAPGGGSGAASSSS